MRAALGIPCAVHTVRRRHHCACVFLCLHVHCAYVRAACAGVFVCARMCAGFVRARTCAFAHMAVVLLIVAYSLSTLVVFLSEVVLVEGEVGTDIYLLDDGKLTVSTKEHGTVPLRPIQSTTGHSRTYAMSRWMSRRWTRACASSRMHSMQMLRNKQSPSSIGCDRFLNDMLMQTSMLPRPFRARNILVRLCS
jgi:hypothetical protein